MGLPLQTDFPALLAVLGLLSTAYMKEFAFPCGPGSSQGVGVVAVETAGLRA